MVDNKQRLDYLLVIETQKTKYYLFASPFMRETRGASVLLDRLNRKVTEDLLASEESESYQVIYLGGGSGRILFAEGHQAKGFKVKLERRYGNDAANARIAIEVVKRNADEAFATWIARGMAKTHGQKLGGVWAEATVAGRWVRPCTSCGQNPAEQVWVEHGQHRLCRGCYSKRLEIREHLYHKIKPGEEYTRLLGKKQLVKRYTKRFIFSTLADQAEGLGYSLQLPQDFEGIGRYSWPSNYMGFIYADGNRMGEIVQSIGHDYPGDTASIAAYRAFSEITDQATREAAVEAVLEVVAPKKSFGNDRHDDDEWRYLPTEFILAGGDDLMLVVPAQHALDVAVRFLEKYQMKTCALQQKAIAKGLLQRPFALGGMTSSAGIVLAHTHYPASELMTLSAELMKLAKLKAAKLGTSVSTLDFMVLNESATESVTHRRKKEYQCSSRSPYEYTERPYTVAEARKLLTVIRALKAAGLPRTKLKALYPLLFQSEGLAMFNGQRLKERLHSTGAISTRSKVI